MAFLVFDENASKQSDHVRSMQKNIGFLERHALVKRTGKMIDPHSVLTTHVFLLTVLFLFTTKQQALCGDVSENSRSKEKECVTY